MGMKGTPSRKAGKPQPNEPDTQEKEEESALPEFVTAAWNFFSEHPSGFDRTGLPLVDDETYSKLKHGAVGLHPLNYRKALLMSLELPAVRRLYPEETQRFMKEEQKDGEREVEKERVRKKRDSIEKEKREEGERSEREKREKIDRERRLCVETIERWLAQAPLISQRDLDVARRNLAANRVRRLVPQYAWGDNMDAPWVLGISIFADRLAESRNFDLSAPGYGKLPDGGKIHFRLSSSSSSGEEPYEDNLAIVFEFRDPAPRWSHENNSSFETWRGSIWRKDEETLVVIWHRDRETQQDPQWWS